MLKLPFFLYTFFIIFFCFQANRWPSGSATPVAPTLMLSRGVGVRISPSSWEARPLPRMLPQGAQISLLEGGAGGGVLR
ncbi:Uncharacterized protein TCM_035009 [Theobroma cacao]|uniref:Secreted protein n=1 Tax=Theobroma cacao TaxID=3641 RepID=A0A061FH04_THECC|nr:Uncharacterized protein TCM_035009 [Theobroma cacao]